MTTRTFCVAPPAGGGAVVAVVVADGEPALFLPLSQPAVRSASASATARRASREKPLTRRANGRAVWLRPWFPRRAGYAPTTSRRAPPRGPPGRAGRTPLRDRHRRRRRRRSPRGDSRPRTA